MAHNPPPHSPASTSTSSSSGPHSAANSPTATGASSPHFPQPRGATRHGAALQTLADAASQSSPLSSGRHSHHHQHSSRQQLQEASSPDSQGSYSPPLGPVPESNSASSPQTASSSVSVSAPIGSGATTATLGPLSATIVLPPRKQPGRKRATEEPIDKRTAQNRTAQRAYRERRAQVEEEQRKRLTELETETVPQLNAKIAHYEAQFQRDQERIRALMEELERERLSTSSGIGSKRRSPPKQLPDHDDKRARHDAPSERNSVTPDAGVSPSAASPYTGSSGYFSDDRRRSSVTLPSVSELSLLSGKGQRTVSTGSGVKLPSLSEYSISSAPLSSGLHRTAHNSHYQSHQSSTHRRSPMSEIHTSTTSSSLESSHAAVAGGSRHHKLGLPLPASVSSTSTTPVSSSSSLQSLYSTSSSSAPVAATATSPSSHSDASSPPTLVATAATTTHRFPAAMQKLALRNPATDGCGNCEEGGSCPCVDTMLNVDEEEQESEASGEVLYTEIKG